MNALTKIDNRALATTASAECSPELWRRLTDEHTPYQLAVDRLADNPQALAELKEALPALERHAAGCGRSAVVTALSPLVTLYGVPDKSEGEWRAFWGFYVEALGDVPAEALKAGVADYVAKADSEFFPRPGPLKAICERHAILIRMAASRARRAAETWPDRLRTYERNAFWNTTDWGPKPGKPGCRVPAEYLDQAA